MLPERIKNQPFLPYQTKMEATGKLNKIPKGSSTDPKTWRTYDEIKEGHRGVVLSLLHDESTTLICIDFDKVVGSEFEPAILTLSNRAWMEVSISGTGYHAFFLLTTDSLNGRDLKNRYKTPMFGDIEFYYTGRFIALSENEVPGSQLTIITLDELESLLEITFCDKTAKERADKTQGTPVNRKINDSDIDISYEATEDLSADVFKWVAKVYGYTRIDDDIEHLKELFHQTDLCIREGGKYHEDGGNKFSRILPSILARLDLGDLRIKAGTMVPFEPVDEEELEELVEKEKQEIEDVRLKYIRLFEEIFHCRGAIRKNIFDGYAYARIQGKLRNIEDPELIATTRDECRVRNAFLKKDEQYKPNFVADAITAYRTGLKEELLIDIQEWDGIDRIKHLSSLLNFADYRLDANVFEYFLRDFLIRAVHKVMTGKGVNRMLVIQGGQGIGKDSFLGMLMGGWGYLYAREISAPSKFDGEAVLLEQVHNLAMASLRELDRFDPVALKRLIDAPEFSFRQKYGKNTVSYPNRTSFVASCNPVDPFTDETGNRRFLFFKLSGRPDTEAAASAYPFLPVAIKRDFDDQDQYYKKQVLAQSYHEWRSLGRIPMQVNSEYESIMISIIEEASPVDGETMNLIEEFDLMFKAVLEGRAKYGDTRRLIEEKDLRNLGEWEVFAHNQNMSFQKINKILTNSGRRTRETSRKYAKNTYYYHLEHEFTEENRERVAQLNRGMGFGAESYDVDNDVPF